MQLAIPKAPRAVTLHQVPGALARLAAVFALAVVVAAGLTVVGLKAGTWLSSERAFFENAREVQGQVLSVKVPPATVDESKVATMTVLYRIDDREESQSGVSLSVERAREVRPGSTVTLLVDPAHPSQPREAAFAREQSGTTRFIPFGIGLGLLLGALLMGLEVRRQVRAELAPLKVGMLVWLTPDDEVPDTRRETTFAASYFRDDQKYAVRARGRPGRAPVKNGAKLLAAVVPSQPTWVRVIDEDLARSLGWYL